jgi:RHS repeat-associated protein
VGNGLAQHRARYDARARPTEDVYVLDGTAYRLTTSYGYPRGAAPAGAGSVPVGRTFSDGERVAYTYDLGGKSQGVTAGGDAIVLRVRHNARGEPTAIDYADGTTTVRAYDDGDMRLKQIVTRGPAGVLQSYGYRSDSEGNVIAVDDYCDAPADASQAAVSCCDPTGVPQDNPCDAKPLSAAYAYDTLDRLTRMDSQAGGATYAYDDAGNLTSKEDQPQRYGEGAGPHALTHAGDTAYAYDANGNVTAAGGTTLAWNAENMPVRASDGTTTVDKWFVGEEIWKKREGDATTFYLPSSRMELHGLRKYYGDYAERDPDEGGAVKFHHGDHLGSATLVTKAGAPVFRAAYYPYGERWDGAERFANASMPFQPKHRFNDKEKDGLGFYDFGARLYNPRTGRWLSPDTSEKDGFNRYAYVSNNPLRWIDPSGHHDEEPKAPKWEKDSTLVEVHKGPIAAYQDPPENEKGETLGESPVKMLPEHAVFLFRGFRDDYEVIESKGHGKYDRVQTKVAVLKPLDESEKPRESARSTAPTTYYVKLPDLKNMEKVDPKKIKREKHSAQAERAREREQERDGRPTLCRPGERCPGGAGPSPRRRGGITIDGFPIPLPRK